MELKPVTVRFYLAACRVYQFLKVSILNDFEKLAKFPADEIVFGASMNHLMYFKRRDIKNNEKQFQTTEIASGSFKGCTIVSFNRESDFYLCRKFFHLHTFRAYFDM